MSPKLARILKRLGYVYQGIEKNNARFVVTAVKTSSGQTYLARHIGVTEADAEDKLGRMLERP